MPLEPGDAGYVWDMLKAARNIRKFVDGIEYQAFLADDMRSLAVERAFEIIGEAARSLSPGVRDRHPDVPWSSIIGLRNVIAHEYGQIDYEALYKVAVTRVPELVAVLEKLMPGDSPRL